MRRDFKSTYKCLKWALLLTLQISNQSLILPIFNTTYLIPLSRSLCDELLQLTKNCRHQQFTHHVLLKPKSVRSAKHKGHVQSTAWSIHLPGNIAMTQTLNSVWKCCSALKCVKASWYHLCEPVATAPCNFTALQKAVNVVNPAVMRQNARKIGLTLGYLQVNQVNSYPRPIHKLNHSSHAYLAYPVLRNTFSKHTMKIINRGEWKPKSCQKKNVGLKTSRFLILIG
jgi:hypothetical protein